MPGFLPKAQDRAEILAKVEKITSKIKLDDQQKDRIVALPSYRWARDAYQEIVNRLAELEARIAENQAIMADPAKMRAIYRSEVRALKKLPAIDR